MNDMDPIDMISVACDELESQGDPRSGMIRAIIDVSKEPSFRLTQSVSGVGIPFGAEARISRWPRGTGKTTALVFEALSLAVKLTRVTKENYVLVRDDPETFAGSVMLRDNLVLAARNAGLSLEIIVLNEGRCAVRVISTAPVEQQWDPDVQD